MVDTNEAITINTAWLSHGDKLHMAQKSQLSFAIQINGLRGQKQLSPMLLLDKQKSTSNIFMGLAAAR